MSDILQRILATKVEEVAFAKARKPLSQLDQEARALNDVRDFAGALVRRIAMGEAAVIAEIKKASPSKGVLRADFDPSTIAAGFAANGAACLSVLTDRRYFQGAPEFIERARGACDLPVLRKDFIIDEYQVAEARALGADAILLIVAALTDAKLAAFEARALDYEMSVLVEVHDREELERALALRTRLIGINNRNLRTFEVSLETTLSLLPLVPPERTVITESGILRPEDVARMRTYGVDAFLVGEACMRAPDPGLALRALFGAPAASMR